MIKFEKFVAIFSLASVLLTFSVIVILNDGVELDNPLKEKNTYYNYILYNSTYTNEPNYNFSVNITTFKEKLLNTSFVLQHTQFSSKERGVCEYSCSYLKGDITLWITFYGIKSIDYLYYGVSNDAIADNFSIKIFFLEWGGKNQSFEDNIKEIINGIEYLNDSFPEYNITNEDYNYTNLSYRGVYGIYTKEEWITIDWNKFN